MGHLKTPDGIAYVHRAGTGPTIVFLPGYASDMDGAKALALDAFAAETGRAMLRFDYSGCGHSDGRFKDGTLDTWLADALSVIDRTDGPLLLVGSSMGGWIMLLAALARAGRVVALVGIAAAPDFTEWGFTADEKRILVETGRLEAANPYGPEPTVTTHAFWRSGQAHRLLDAPIAIDVPVRLLHGMADADVPWPHSPRLAAALRSADVQTLLVKDGDHRLSRPQDIALLIAAVEALAEPA